MLYDHVDFRVGDVAKVRPLYDALFSAWGYADVHADGESVGYHKRDETGDDAFFWIVEEKGHVPNGTRIAFAVPTRGDVDRFSEMARRNGAREFDGPLLMTEYGPNYYASFFDDAEGNKLEICCRRPE